MAVLECTCKNLAKIENFNQDLSIAWLKLLLFFGGWIAQSVEQQTENLRVGSSILPLTTIAYFLQSNAI